MSRRKPDEDRLSTPPTASPKVSAACLASARDGWRAARPTYPLIPSVYSTCVSTHWPTASVFLCLCLYREFIPRNATRRKHDDSDRPMPGDIHVVFTATRLRSQSGFPLQVNGNDLEPAIFSHGPVLDALATHQNERRGVVILRSTPETLKRRDDSTSRPNDRIYQAGVCAINCSPYFQY